MSYKESADSAMRAFLENMLGTGLLAKEIGMDTTPSKIVDASLSQIMKIAQESLPLAQVMDESDLVFHAEGPGASHDLPWLSALNWITQTAESNLRHLSSATFDLHGADGKLLSKSVDLRLTGMAPGSLWIGVKMMPPQADLLPEDSNLIRTMVQQIGVLPEITRFIDDEGMRPGIEEASPDPAMRDVQLATLYRFSPTGRRGIHTLEISSQEFGSASLSQRERVVLREVIARPDTKSSIEGSFIGHVREADLDKTRLHLRGVEGIGTLRCVMPNLTADHARALLGNLVRAEGKYLTDREGKPRLLFIERITPIEQRTLLM
ncbi:MAG: hypothetical protein Q8J80_01370 [Gallionella sp.]|nr:hypothetical protein [Gallionella sp.]